ncbi:2,3-bisphosphoglycerate-independent phosphoglycerate mutase-like isoform X2 [Antedon mediterranea]|uniref:2,3-bisphosphoglycerate-independent phosphoglycerate mutase-like isoform X2 n=1 Tax=Antedon mediterranea TaxID=105859 RepID=UPI003AF65471
MSVCLVVIDGWGLSDNVEGNAIKNAETPIMDSLCNPANSQFVTLDASGLAVGLPDGLMGNSEVGHLTIGAGRIIYQDIVKIDLAIKNGEFGQQKAFVDACTRAIQGNGRLHFLGLVSDGGVHSHINHLLEFLKAAKSHGVPKSFVQFFGDGRDTSPVSGVKYLQQVLDFLKQEDYGCLATVVGRYYAMDRDKRHERIKLAYEGLVQGIGESTTPENVIQVVNARYANKETDEFLKPIIVEPEGRIQDGDTLVFIDFRSDRMRQIVEAFAIQRHFETSVVPKDLHVVCMTQYKSDFGLPVIYPPTSTVNVLAEWIASKKMTQYHCAETEKYAHVTFFFNGGVEKSFEGEQRCLVQSPKVATYDLQPEMSVMGVAEKMVETIESGKFPFVMCNLAPPDMVGHTGVYDATVKACTQTDKAIGLMVEACKKHNYTFLVTADHGNAELMIDEAGKPVTKHSTNRVPFGMTGEHKFKNITHNASLADVAPTVLSLMGLDIPSEMTGQTLLHK